MAKAMPAVGGALDKLGNRYTALISGGTMYAAVKSAAAMETLAIVAFKQPVTRGEMEAIRGVKVDGVVNTLLEYGLICEAGRKEALGRPILYATTDKFLLTFGLNSLKDLPALPDEDSSGPEQISLLDSLKDADSNTQNDGV